MEDYIRGLLEGDLEPENDTIAYLVGRVRGLRGAHQDQQNKLGQLRRQAKAAEDELNAIAGAHDSTIVDLKHWIEESGTVKSIEKGA